MLSTNKSWMDKLLWLTGWKITSRNQSHLGGLPFQAIPLITGFPSLTVCVEILGSMLQNHSIDYIPPVSPIHNPLIMVTTSVRLLYR